MPEPGDVEKHASVKRVERQPLRWEFLDDEPGQQLHALHHKLIRLRHEYAGLRSGNFHPSG
jgi:hypothetical protein